MRRVREELGRYRIVRKIADGGMAEIYLARQRGIEGLERTVVLKQILEKHEQSEEFVTMFLDEARLMAALSHPNIAQVLDLARADDTHYLVMEYVRGPTLGAMLAAAQKAGAGGLPEKPALGIALAIAEALHYVHERRDELGRPLGIVHRDLNPANVLVSYDGAVKLIDFGIAKAATKVYETRTGVIKGTYGYIAPEVLTGSAQVDRRADVFALGILLYEALVGKHPFDASDEPNLLDRILEARYKRPRDVRPDLPAALDRLIARCLAPHPEGRPGTMQELIDALAAHMAAAGIVPTQRDLAALATELVPDAEGPQPLRRPTSVKPRPVFPRESAAKDGGTRRVSAPIPDAGRAEVGLADAGLADAGLADGEPDPTERGPRLAVDAAGTRKIARPAAAEPVTESVEMAAVQAEEPTAARGRDFDPDAATLRSHAAEGPPEVVEAEDPTIVGAPGPEWLPEPVIATPSPGRASRPGEPTLRLPPAPGRRTVQPVLGALGLVLAGVAAFAAARAVGGSAHPAPVVEIVPASSSIPADAGASGAIPRALTVVSDPPGAAIRVDGADVGLRTPAVIAIDAQVARVTVSVSLAGYAAQSRPVSTSVPEARFVLTSVDAGGASGIAQSPTEAGPAEASTTERRRPRRRPRRR